MARIVLCLELVFSSGGHIHLEQPTNSMAWLEPEVRRLIKFCAPHLVHLPACKYGANWQKSWLFACSYRALISLSGKCNHPSGTHEAIAGVRLPDGSFKSRQTAEYPATLCDMFATIVSPLCQPTAAILTLEEATQAIPVKTLHDLPVSYEDGGGLRSQPDWSRPFRVETDVFCTLRKAWMQHILKNRLHHKIYQFLQSDSTDPPLSEDDITPFLTEAGLPVSWVIRDDQPLHLDILSQLSQLMQDADSTLFPFLIRGVTTGIEDDVPPSTCFPSASDIIADPVPLSIHMTNWQSAEQDLDTTRELVTKEVEKGWVYRYHGDLAQAQQEPSHPHLLKSFVVSFNCNLNLIDYHAHNSHRFRDLFKMLQPSIHSHSTPWYLLHQCRTMIPCVHFILKCRLCFSRVQSCTPMAALLRAIPFPSRFDFGFYALSIIPSCVFDGRNCCVFPQFISLACFSFNTG